MKKRVLCAAVLAVAAVLSGCATAARPGGVREFYTGDHASARRLYEQNLEKEPRSRGLYHLRLATLELSQGNLVEARDQFLEATRIMQDFTASGEFKAIVGAESSKEYKGDPYEQMMALWYLGLTDYMLGDWQMALPSFKSAAIADGGTTDERYRSDAASVFLMLAKTYQAMGDRRMAGEEYREAAGVHTFRETVSRVSAALADARKAAKARNGEQTSLDAAYVFLADGVSAGASREQDPALALVEAREFAFEALEKASRARRGDARLDGRDPNIVGGYIRELAVDAEARLAGAGGPAAQSPLAPVIEQLSNPANNFLVVAGLGHGPFKYRSGEYGEMARIGRRDYPERHAEVYVDGRFVGRTQAVEDVHYQASTRGGREMDGILAGKAVFKGLTEFGATAAFITAGLSSSRTGQRDALIVGASLLALSLATRPEADIRSWETLPDRIHMLAAVVPPGRHAVEVRFMGAGGPVPAMTYRWEDVDFSVGRETVLYVRSGAGGTLGRM